ncbi:Ion channel [Seminavis robusta]|uniref:Ion channel n=1 Tax=Seminavis robusta TaxID=568900 RepID=A0A9N8EVE7_9STRA|nr:Ion channel [Seminavis robusta]|eukprot:Sro1939_g306580.1 Ion channel (525) ;mRNA; r:10306-11880
MLMTMRIPKSSAFSLPARTSLVLLLLICIVGHCQFGEAFLSLNHHKQERSSFHQSTTDNTYHEFISLSKGPQMQELRATNRAPLSFSRIRTSTRQPSSQDRYSDHASQLLISKDDLDLPQQLQATKADEYRIVSDQEREKKNSKMHKHGPSVGSKRRPAPEQPEWILHFSAAQQQVDQFKMKIQTLIEQPLVECAGAAQILLSSILVAVTTLPDVPDDLLVPMETVQETLAYLFLAEFLTRWFSCTDKKGGRYVTQPLVLVDVFVVVLPLLLTNFPLLDAAFPDFISGQSGLINLRLLRVLRLQRVLKDELTFSKFVNAVQLNSNRSSSAIVQQWELQLARVMLSLFTLLSVAAGLIYTTENAANPNIDDYFTALYFTLTTLTTVGFGDITPMTWQGKLVVSGSILAGITIIPAQAASLVEALFQRGEEQQRQQQEQENRQRQMLQPAKATDRRYSSGGSNSLTMETISRDLTRSSSSTNAEATLEAAKKCPVCKVGLHWSHATYCYNCASPLGPEKTLVLPEK